MHKMHGKSTAHAQLLNASTKQRAATEQIVCEWLKCDLFSKICSFLTHDLQ